MSQAAKQADDGNVLLKLLSFSIALAVVPIGAYFLSLNYFWNGEATWAALTAVAAANVVIVAFIIVAAADDRKERAARQSRSIGDESKKTQ